MPTTADFLIAHESCHQTDSTHPTHKAVFNLHWSFANAKLKKDHVVSFNLPAFRSQTGETVCHNASTCALVCYARQGHYVQRHVWKPREHNFACVCSWPTQTLIGRLCADLDAMHATFKRFRIHDSGDFLSPAYFHAWLAVVRHCRDKQFYGYTKMISLLAEHRHLLPPNLHLIQSVGGKEDSLIDTRYAHAVIFPTHEARKRAGYVDATHSDKPAFSGKKKLGLVYHGVAKLTASNNVLLTQRAQDVIGD